MWRKAFGLIAHAARVQRCPLDDPDLVDILDARSIRRAVDYRMQQKTEKK